MSVTSSPAIHRSLSSPTLPPRGVSPERGYHSTIVFAAMVLVPLPAAELIASNISTELALRVLAGCAILSGITAFLYHGRDRLTAAGVYCLATGVTLGYGGWYWAAHPSADPPNGAILTAAVSVYLTTAVAYFLFWHRSVKPEAGRQGPVAASLASRLRLEGIALFVVGAIGQRLGVNAGGLPSAAAYLGVILFAASLLLRGRIRALQSPIRTCVVGIALFLYYLIIFHGFGRLILVGLVMTTLFIAQYRIRARIKPLVVAILVPALAFFGAVREAQSTNAATTSSNPYHGLGSVVGPLQTYAQLINRHLTGSLGSAFVADAVIPVPRSIWAGKPVQFGAVLTRLLQPQSVHSHLSLAALSQGEWYYSFGWLGLLLVIPVIGLIVRFLDTRLMARQLDDLEASSTLYTFIGLTVLAGSLGDLAWNGMSTWLARNVVRLIPLAAVLVVVKLVPEGVRLRDTPRLRRVNATAERPQTSASNR